MKYEPLIAWLPGLANPRSYLLTVLQTACRKYHWPIEQAGLVAQITNAKHLPAPKDVRILFVLTPPGSFTRVIFLRAFTWKESTWRTPAGTMSAAVWNAQKFALCRWLCPSSKSPRRSARRNHQRWETFHLFYDQWIIRVRLELCATAAVRHFGAHWATGVGTGPAVWWTSQHVAPPRHKTCSQPWLTNFFAPFDVNLFGC